jgi:hypothetical protein
MNMPSLSHTKYRVLPVFDSLHGKIVFIPQRYMYYNDKWRTLPFFPSDMGDGFDAYFHSEDEAINHIQKWHIQWSERHNHIMKLPTSLEVEVWDSYTLEKKFIKVDD